MINTDTEEYNLAVRAHAGDLDALSELVERSRLSLFGLAYAEIGHYEDAQDVLVAALSHICLHISALQEPEHVRTWMWSIVRNEARQFRRKRQPRLDDTSVEWIPSDANSLPACLLRVDVERALEKPLKMPTISGAKRSATAARSAAADRFSHIGSFSGAQGFVPGAPPECTSALPPAPTRCS